MVQPAESRQGLNLAFTLRANFCRPTCWRVLRESEVSPVLMIVEQVRRHQTFEMPLVQDDHVVKQVASATSHPTLSNTVLPRTDTRCSPGRILSSHTEDQGANLFADTLPSSCLSDSADPRPIQKRKRPNQALRQVLHFADVRPFGEAQPIFLVLPFKLEAFAHHENEVALPQNLVGAFGNVNEFA